MIKKSFAWGSPEFEAASKECNSDDRSVINVTPTTWGDMPAWRVAMDTTTGLLVTLIKPLL